MTSVFSDFLLALLSAHSIFPLSCHAIQISGCLVLVPYLLGKHVLCEGECALSSGEQEGRNEWWHWEQGIKVEELCRIAGNDGWGFCNLKSAPQAPLVLVKVNILLFYKLTSLNSCIFLSPLFVAQSFLHVQVLSVATPVLHWKVSVKCRCLKGFPFGLAWCLEVPSVSTGGLDLISKGLKLMILSMVEFYCSSGGLKPSATLWPLPSQSNSI